MQTLKECVKRLQQRDCYILVAGMHNQTEPKSLGIDPNGNLSYTKNSKDQFFKTFRIFLKFFNDNFHFRSLKYAHCQHLIAKYKI